MKQIQLFGLIVMLAGWVGSDALFIFGAVIALPETIRSIYPRQLS
jgi:hypothetical protein